MSSPDNSCICSDGLPGRSSGEWARTKLQFLEDYLPPALAVTHNFSRRWFIDLFAGPGRNADRHRQPGEFDGSPLRALDLCGSDKAKTPFTDAVFVNNVEWEHLALATRVSRVVEGGKSRIPINRIRLLRGDANNVLPQIMKSIGKRDYVIAFADITGPSHWPFTSVEELRRQGHRSVDFYMLFPLEMALVRKLSFRKEMTERYAADITAFFGTDEWRPIWERRRTSSDTQKLKLELIELYRSQLGKVWKHPKMQEKIGRSAKARLYSMFFATDNEIGSNLAKWQQRRLQPDFFT